MAYTPTTFVSGTTPAVDAAELNKLGAGIALAQSTAELAATTAALAQTTAAAITTGLANRTHAARTSDASAVTSLTPIADPQLTTALTAVTGHRIGVTFYLIFTADPTSTPISLGLSATDAANDVTGTMYVSARTATGASQGACVSLGSTGQAMATVPVTGSGVQFVHGSASLLVGSSTGTVTIAVLSAQTMTGSGIVLLKGSCLFTELLT